MSVTVPPAGVIARDAYPIKGAHRAPVTTALLWATPLKLVDTPAGMPTKGLFFQGRSCSCLQDKLE